MKRKTVIVITGPTAAGKTALSLQLALQFNTSIISSDSRQCFRDLNVGVAKPADSELQLVKHYFINSHSISEDVNAAVFEKEALHYSELIFKEKDALIMVGGTGLYIKAFCEGLDEMPAISPDIRTSIQLMYAEKGIQWLQEKIAAEDPDFYSRGEILNPQRLMRALEIKRSTGVSILSYRNRKPKERPFDIIKFAVDLSKDELHQRISHRVDKMIADGLVAEVKGLMPYRNLNALQTVGYKEFFDYLDGKQTLPETIEEIKKNTRQYAKRQMTWFKKDKDIRWFSADDIIKISRSELHSEG